MQEKAERRGAERLPPADSGATGNYRLMGIDPVEYFRAVLPMLPRRIRELTDLLPAPWKARRAAAAAYAGSGDDSASSTPSS